ncbi:tape measure protein [Chryseobacterium indologenes]|uniref:tape measure protein n=1 Tax=Chryseobacterium indologenes TaxID=253 RepID=UPI001F4B1720|nr:tape measure protein [Chryseobacterium indologenes]
MPDKLAVLQTQVIIADLRKIESAGKEVNQMFKEMVTNTEKINRAFNSGKIREYTAAIQALNQATSQYTTMERQLADAMARTARLEQQQARLQTEQARTRRELAEARRAESRERQQAAREAQNEERQNRNSASAHAQLTRETRQARQTARDYGAEIIQLKNKLRQGTITQQEYRTQMSQLSRDFRTSTNEAIRLERELRRLNQQTLPSNQRNGALQGRVTDILKALGITSIVDNVASSFYKLGVAYKDTALKLETLHLAQKSIFKTNEEVGRQNAFLTEVSQKYGVELISLSQAYNNFSASAQGTVLEGEKSKVIFDAVAKSSAMLGVTTDDTNGILKALGQMMSKGKVQAEELRGQLGDRMAGAFRLFADGMGVSTAQLDKMLKKGEVIAEDVLPKFAEQLNKKYKLGIGEDIETSQASLTRLTNSWTIFVDAVEKRSNVVGGSISSLTKLISGMLKELTPSETITSIQREQLEFNKLGIILRQNFGDVKRRKEIIDEMIALNPFWLDGLDKEKVTLEQIADRLKMTNEQYVQKIILQKYEDQINEVLEEQAERIGIIAEAYGKYSTSINNLTLAQQNIIQSYTDGTINLEQANEAMKKLGGNWHKGTTLLWAMSEAVDQNAITSKGFISTMKNLNRQGTELTDKYNLQIKAIQKLTSTNGNLLGINTSLIGSNYSLGKSYDFMKQKQDMAARQQNQDYQKAIKQARELKQAYTSFNGYFFDATTAKNTGKKVGEWDIVDNKLVKRQPMKLEEDPEKPKAAKLTVAEKDFVNKATGIRDAELAALEERKLDLKVNEEQYWKEYEKIYQQFSDKITGFIKGANAKQIQVEGSVYRKAVEARKQASKAIYDIQTKNLEENFKKEQNITERETKNLEQNRTISDVERLNQQIKLDNKLIEQLDQYYSNQINLAREKGQSVIEWERKRDEEIGKIQDEQLKRAIAIPDALNTEIERQSEILQSNKAVSYEKEKQLILTNKKLSAEEKSYQLSVLELKNEIATNDREIEKQKAIQDTITGRLSDEKLAGLPGIPTQDDIKKLSEAAEIIEKLTSENLQNNKDLDLLGIDKIAKGLSPVVDLISSGLNDLGLNAVSDQFTKMYDKILKEGKDFSMSTKEYFQLATAVISDFSKQFTEAQKNRTIAALDEQLNYSQKATEQEVNFINGRLEALNNLTELNEEQIVERNRLEDEARTYQEQQRQREKLIATQKARAEQRAAAQQALINGALAASLALASSPPPASYIMAALAAAFGVAQSVAIMSKNPVPQYFVGTSNAREGIARIDEFGAEIHTDKNDNIKSLGDNKGSKLRYMEAGDKVYTAIQSRQIMQTMGLDAQVGRKLYKNAARQSMMAPQVTVVNNQRDNSDAIARKIGREMLKNWELVDKETKLKIRGFIYLQRGRNYPEEIGTYDLKTGEEKYY